LGNIRGIEDQAFDPIWKAEISGKRIPTLPCTGISVDAGQWDDMWREGSFPSILHDSRCQGCGRRTELPAVAWLATEHVLLNE